MSNTKKGLSLLMAAGKQDADSITTENKNEEISTEKAADNTEVKNAAAGVSNEHTEAKKTADKVIDLNSTSVISNPSSDNTVKNSVSKKIKKDEEKKSRYSLSIPVELSDYIEGAGKLYSGVSAYIASLVKKDIAVNGETYKQIYNICHK